MTVLLKHSDIILTPEYMRKNFNIDLTAELGKMNMSASGAADAYCNMAYNACIDWAVEHDVRMSNEADVRAFLNNDYKIAKFIYAQGLCLVAWLENGRGGVIQREDGEWFRDMPTAAIKVLRNNVGFNKTNWVY